MGSKFNVDGPPTIGDSQQAHIQMGNTVLLGFNRPTAFVLQGALEALDGRAHDQQGHIESDDEGKNNQNAEQRVVNDPAQQAVMPGVVAWIFGWGATPLSIKSTGAMQPNINGNRRVGDRRGDD